MLCTSEFTCFLHCLQPSSQRVPPHRHHHRPGRPPSPWVDGGSLVVSMTGARQERATPLGVPSLTVVGGLVLEDQPPRGTGAPDLRGAWPRLPGQFPHPGQVAPATVLERGEEKPGTCCRTDQGQYWLLWHLPRRAGATSEGPLPCTVLCSSIVAVLGAL